MTKDWVEDFQYENGNYQNRCVFCEELFAGHKRRVVCKECASQELDTELEAVKDESRYQ